MSKEIAQLLARAGDAELMAVMAMVDGVQSRAALASQIDAIRPKLALLKPPRPASLNRLLVMPFEDLLVAEAQWLPGSMLVARARLGSFHDGVKAALSAAELAALKQDLRGVMMTDSNRLCRIGAGLWPRAAAAIAALARSGQAKGDDTLREQCQNASDMLAIAELVCPLLQVLPARPMGDLSPFQIEAVVACLERCEARSPADFVAGMQWLIARSFKPTVLLNLLLRRQIGRAIVAPEVLAHRLAVQILERQRALATFLAAHERPLLIMTADLEQATGSFLAIADKAREFDLAPSQLEGTRKAMRDVILAKLAFALTDNYLSAVERLDDPTILDEDVERIEGEARAIHRLATLAEVCGGKSRLEALLARAAEDAATELRGRYGANADPMVVVDQLRTFELVFGGEHARKLWLEFAKRRNGGEALGRGTSTPQSESERAAHAMMSAINSLYAIR